MSEVTPAEEWDDPLLEFFVSAREAEKMLGISRSHIYKLLDDGVIESRRFGTRRLILLSSLREFARKLPA